MIFNRCLIAIPPFEDDMVKLAGQIGRQPVCFALEKGSGTNDRKTEDIL